MSLRGRFTNWRLRRWPRFDSGHGCTFVVNHDVNRSCADPAVAHLRFEVGFAGRACEGHRLIPIATFKEVQRHEYGGDCDMPGALWDPERNICVAQGEELTVEQVLEAELVDV